MVLFWFFIFIHIFFTYFLYDSIDSFLLIHIFNF